jgi:hypothetical protein
MKESVLKRLSNGAMLHVHGGSSASFTDETLQSALCDCLAGCG